MLNFLSLNSQEKVIGVSLTPGIGLEAIELDKTGTVVSNYARRKVEYNFSNREPQNYGQLKTALVELMDVMKIAPKTPVYFILPNVLFDFVELPPALSTPEIKLSILSETEKFYLFKKEDPYFGWQEIPSMSDEGQKKLVYTAFQRNTVESIKEIITDIGLQLRGIESAYSATLRGLLQTGIADELVEENSSWTVMLVSTNSYTLFHLEGGNLVNYNEVPVAIKSYSTEEAYDNIVSSSSQLLSNSTSTRLYIISQTDDISADILKKHMDFDNEIVAINSNKHSKKPILEVTQAENFNLINSMTFSAIAAAGHISAKMPKIILNVLVDDPDASLGIYFKTNFLGKEVEVTKQLVMSICILAAVAGLVIFGGLTLALFGINKAQTSKLDGLNQEISNVDQQISALSDVSGKTEIDINSVIDEVAQENVSVISFYDSISSDIPKNVWLTKYYNKSGDKIAVKGIAQSIIDIYEYYKNLRIVSPQANIKLNELKVITQASSDSDDAKQLQSLAINKDTDRLYSFEISNIDSGFGAAVAGALNQAGAALTGGQTGQDGQAQAGQPAEQKPFSNFQIPDEINIIKSQNSNNNQNVEQTSNQMVPTK